ncbi:mechanosensitive ion channel family protein [Actinoplanes missouriensis]|uniref:mechanosensitive ion channel family protein n=1 Tax=Actinoplanes missouriensis TaxID=1866 RepID=UPI0033E207DC
MWRIDEHLRPDFRKAVGFGLIAMVALVIGTQVGDVQAASWRERLIPYACALLVGIFGVTASRTAANEVHRVAVARAGDEAATPLRIIVMLGGYLASLFAACDLFGAGLQHLLVGGAVTGIILGLAAQPVLGNLFAGLVLLFARPYLPGHRIRVISGPLGEHSGVIVSAGLLYTVLETDEGPLNIPNTVLLAAGVGPLVKAETTPQA